MRRSVAFLTALAALSCKQETRAPTQAAPVPSPGALKFAIMGDYGADTPDEYTVSVLVKSWNVDFIVTTGDNNYPDGAASTIDQNIGKFYSDFIGNYHGRFGAGSTVNRFWPSPGNHDWVSPGLVPYIEYFTLPGNERYYDVAIGLVHLYAIDSDPHEPDGVSADSVQGKWLQGRLAASRECYDLVYFHHPPYSSGPHGSSLDMRWPFRAWGAEAVLAGHDHTYERFEIDGIPYVVIGLGGAPKYEFAPSALSETKARYNERYGAVRVSVLSTAITYEFITTDGVVRDSYTMKKSCTN